ncbi:phospholipid-translocating ATPase [Microdochium nivale]|nr:phospholipid-translocating ATPase [Microdochium nivale]
MADRSPPGHHAHHGHSHAPDASASQSAQPRRFPLSPSRPATAASDQPTAQDAAHLHHAPPPASSVVERVRRSLSTSGRDVADPNPFGAPPQRRRSSHISAPVGAGLGDPDQDATKRAQEYQKWVARQEKQTKSVKARLQDGFGTAYQKVVIQGILRQKPLPPSKDGRHIPLQPGAARSHQLTDERRNKHYISNWIRSTRYSLWSFLPKQLYFQFSKLANFYFLVVGILQQVPGLSTTGTWTTIGPLLLFVSVSIAKEGYDDYRRYELDKAENRSAAWVFDPDKTVSKKAASKSKDAVKAAARRAQGNKTKQTHMSDAMELGAVGNCFNSDDGVWAIVEWQDVRVGDIVKLQRDQHVPADMILLHATGPNGVAYIETMALDGETNLKSKQASPLLAERCNTIADLRHCRATIVSEDPNLDLYHYDGRVLVDNETSPLTLNEVVFRGSTLRNTSEAWGLVVNSGEECKIRMNSNRGAPAKAPKMQAWLNRIVLFLVCVLLIITAGCTGGYYLWRGRYDEDGAWYLTGAQVPFVQIWFGFIIMFNTLIPLSLYVVLEIIKIGQLLLMSDVDMYDEETDTPLRINTTTIFENLGQISYVLSDKTGTLTENKMRFRKVTIAGTAWYHDRDIQQEAMERQARRGQDNIGSKVNVGGSSLNPVRPSTTQDNYGQIRQTEANSMAMVDYMRAHPDSAFTQKARFFLLALALCHTATPEKSLQGDITFSASSPDELALVQAARDLGLLLIDRPSGMIKLQRETPNGKLIVDSYQVLDIIEFSSDRKRMSIIVRMPDGKICIFCKGADSAIIPRLRSSKAAAQKAADVERRASERRSSEAGRIMEYHRTSLSSPGTAFNEARASMSSPRASMHAFSRKSTDLQRHSVLRESIDETRPTVFPGNSYSSSQYPAAFSPSPLEPPREIDWSDTGVDEDIASHEAAIFDRCFTHLDEFASDGLRTLLFAHRFLQESEYEEWKTIYQEATTSLVDRQKMIEEAGELIEQKFELTGATAIEDRLQKGVPETVDKLRRANIKVWMLTGDKRETAINIAHSARICKPFSEVFIIDVKTDVLSDKITSILMEVSKGMLAHSVLVIDGQTLSAVEDDPALKIMFFDLVVRIDAVVCCRASPSQKANLVNCIRHTVPGSLTLAIGDGANDIAMIQAAHVGVGISGKEGLQAARVADYSIAQFRFLQRLLFVHGRYVYHRTGKYILATFWKEIVFYIVQAQYQYFVGYTGTSLYEKWSLTLFNIVFTSLSVIMLGIFEVDLKAETLLAIPELYTYGQRDEAFNLHKYIGWMLVACADTAIIYWSVYGDWFRILSTEDDGVFAMGQLAFTVAVFVINFKCLGLELHTKSWLTTAGAIWGPFSWFMWQFILVALFSRGFPQIPYFIRDGFRNHFGKKLSWWVTMLGATMGIIAFELGVSAFRRIYFPTDTDLWQEIEQQESYQEVLREYDPESAQLHMNNTNGNGNGKPSGTADGSGGSLQNEQDQPARPRSFS